MSVRQGKSGAWPDKYPVVAKHAFTFLLTGGIWYRLPDQRTEVAPALANSAARREGGISMVEQTDTEAGDPHGGPFLTEKEGGSDVGQALPPPAVRKADHWRLVGEKWFR